MTIAAAPFNRVLIWLVGFTITFNWLVIPFSGSSPRFTDLVGLIALTLLLLKLGRSRLSRLGVAAVPLSIATLFFVAKGVLVGDSSLMIFGVRLFLAMSAILWVSQTIVETGNQINFLYGMAWGALFVGVIAFGQGTETISAFNLFIPPGTDTWWGDGGRIRAVAIWQHPNSVGQVQALGAAAAAAAAVTGDRLRPLAIALFVGIVGTTYIGTQTRAFLLVSCFSVAVALMASRQTTLKTTAVVVGTFVFLLAPFFLVQVLGDRWFGGDNVPSASENGAERIETVIFSAELILLRPFGYGISGSMEVLIRSFGFAASHNSYISLGLAIGLLPMLFALFMIGYRWTMIAQTKGYRYVAAPLAAICLMFFFEDSIFLPSLLNALTIFCFWGKPILLPIPADVTQQRLDRLSKQSEPPSEV